jgi:hypothetical protein
VEVCWGWRVEGKVRLDVVVDSGRGVWKGEA